MRNVTNSAINKVLLSAFSLVLLALLLIASEKAFADEYVSASWVNPEYQNYVDNKEAPELSARQDVRMQLLITQVPDFEDSVDASRTLMAGRSAAFDVMFRVPVSDAKISLSFQELFDEYLNQVYSYDPDEPRLGDYLHYNVSTVNASGSTGSDSTYKYYNLNFTCTYNSDATMEAWVDSEVPKIVGQLNTELTAAGKQNNQADIFFAIYNYITANVDYDYDHLSDQTYRAQATAYNGLHDGKCVCQGFALIFYRLALEMGLDARYISSNTQNHGWNIVRLGEKWYELDVTWDETKNSSNYAFCLLGSTKWLSSHKTTGSTYSTIGDQYSNTDFATAHPLYSDDFELWTIKTPAFSAISQAQMSITDTLSVSLSLSDSLSDARKWAIVASYQGESYTTTVNAGEYLGALYFNGITAQCMTDEMKVFVRAMYGDEILYSFDTFTFTIRAYCDMLYDLYKSSSTAGKMLTLIADMLEYGAAAQNYAGYRTSALANASSWISSYKTTSAAKPTSDTVVGVATGTSRLSGLALQLGNDVRFCTYITTENATDTLNISDGGYVDEDYIMTDGSAISGGYKIIADGLKALDFSKVFTFNLNDGGQVVSYSVNSYINSKWDSADAKLSALVKALYNYGCSASNAAA